LAIQRFDVAIVGAGLVGLSLAAAIRGSGLSTLLVDAAPATVDRGDAWDTRIYAISPGSSRFLRQCGAWQRMRSERICPVQGMRVRGDAPGAELFFSAYQGGLSELCFIVESSEVQRALADELDASSEIEHRFNAAPVSLEFADDCARLAFDGGDEVMTKLVIGADGVDSFVRREVGIGARQRNYQQMGVVANFTTELPHHGIAHQWFRCDGVLALLPLPGNRVSMVWSTWDANAERLLASDAESLAAEVTNASASALGVLRSTSAAMGFPLRTQSVAELVRPRLALIGDAAHCVHPLAGQGLNLGFQDASLLADTLTQRGAQDDCGDYRLLRRYARARKEPVAMMQLTTDALQRLFNNNLPGLHWLRNAGLALTNRMAPIKRMLVEHALG
jgi:ubiquinone biosynthesis UbiH/UbiF/VisC/COQ6 family hydroxylase